MAVGLDQVYWRLQKFSLLSGPSKSIYPQWPLSLLGHSTGICSTQGDASPTFCKDAVFGREGTVIQDLRAGLQAQRSWANLLGHVSTVPFFLTQKFQVFAALLSALLWVSALSSWLDCKPRGQGSLLLLDILALGWPCDRCRLIIRKGDLGGLVLSFFPCIQQATGDIFPSDLCSIIECLGYIFIPNQFFSTLDFRICSSYCLHHHGKKQTDLVTSDVFK